MHNPRFTGTPAFFVISTNSQQVQTISGAQPYEVFERIFNSMLDHLKNSNTINRSPEFLSVRKSYLPRNLIYPHHEA